MRDTATVYKEEIQKFIEDQLDLGGEGLDKEDKCLLEINLEDPGTSSKEDQHYLLIQFEAARCNRTLREENQNQQ
ncbi:hypothetical protein ACHAWF_012832 [Thalassiosira exigua]